MGLPDSFMSIVRNIVYNAIVGLEALEPVSG
jgi:hypothetical protein